MKKTALIILSLVCAFFCIFGVAACGDPNSSSDDQPTALDKAFDEYYKTENMTVVVKDERAVKYGNDYSTTSKVDFAHKTAYTHRMFGAGTTGVIDEAYFELVGDDNLIIYGVITDTVNGDVSRTKVERRDLFVNYNENGMFSSLEQYQLTLLNSFVENSLPARNLIDTAFRESSESQSNWASLEFITGEFKESESGVYTANIYFCINNDGVYEPYACAVTIRLDGQGRFKSCELDFGTNGKITAGYTYGTANVIIPDDVKNAQYD